MGCLLYLTLGAATDWGWGMLQFDWVVQHFPLLQAARHYLETCAQF